MKGEQFNETNIQSEISILLCFLISKNKFKKILLDFIDMLDKSMKKMESFMKIL